MLFLPLRAVRARGISLYEVCVRMCWYTYKRTVTLSLTLRALRARGKLMRMWYYKYGKQLSFCLSELKERKEYVFHVYVCVNMYVCVHVYGRRLCCCLTKLKERVEYLRTYMYMYVYVYIYIYIYIYREREREREREAPPCLFCQAPRPHLRIPANVYINAYSWYLVVSVVEQARLQQVLINVFLVPRGECRAASQASTGAHQCILGTSWWVSCSKPGFNRCSSMSSRVSRSASAASSSAAILALRSSLFNL